MERLSEWSKSALPNVRLEGILTTPSACNPWTILTYASIFVSLQRTMPMAIGAMPLRARWETGIIELVHDPNSSAGPGSGGYVIASGQRWDCLKRMVRSAMQKERWINHHSCAELASPTTSTENFPPPRPRTVKSPFHTPTLPSCRSLNAGLKNMHIGGGGMKGAFGMRSCFGFGCLTGAAGTIFETVDTVAELEAVT